MHPDPRDRTREEHKISIDSLLTHAVSILWVAEDAGSEFEEGITKLVAAVGYGHDYPSAFRAIKDRDEEMEQEVADEIEKAEAEVKRAEEKLARAKSQRRNVHH